MSKVNASDVITQDLWIHLAAVLAIGLGALAWYMRVGFHSDPSSIELMFMIGGFAGMGLKIVNGSAAQLRNAALDAAYSAKRSAELAAIAAQAATPAPAPAAETP